MLGCKALGTSSEGYYLLISNQILPGTTYRQGQRGQTYSRNKQNKCKHKNFYRVHIDNVITVRI